MRKTNALEARTTASLALLLAAVTLLAGCGSSDSSDTTTDTDTDTGTDTSAVDITNAIFTERSADCADYVNTYEASVVDITESTGFDADVLISSDTDACTFVSNAIPNHDFNDSTAHFGGVVSEQSLEYNVTRSPAIATVSTAL